MKKLAEFAGQAIGFTLRTLILLYRHSFAYFLGGRCRFEPSCSLYASAAIAAHGPWKGSWLAARRLGRCHPWGGKGFDPVPPRVK